MKLRTVIGHLLGHAPAYAALLVALGGTASAASFLVARNSVGSAQVINHSLRRIDFKRGQLPRGPRGKPGPHGPVGARGPTGTQGGPGLATAAVTSISNPPFSPQASLRSTTVDVRETFGGIFGEGRLDTLTFTCSPAGTTCSMGVGLYLDGAPFPGTLATVPSGTSCNGTSSSCTGSITNLVVMGTQQVPGGQHTLSLGVKVLTGSTAEFSPGFAQVTAIALGSQ